MKFSVVSVVASAAFISQALATPAPQGGNTVYHCAPSFYQPSNGTDNIFQVTYQMYAPINLCTKCTNLGFLPAH